MYVLSDTLLLADVLKNFTNKCTEIYELDPANFLSVPGLAWQACLKKDVKLELLTDINILLMTEKGIRGRIYLEYVGMQRQIVSIWKIMIKTLNHDTSCIWMQTICMDGQYLKNCL